METDLTQGSVVRNLLRFSVPYLIACFLQTFYGMADLFIAGQFNGADVITAVSVGSQVMHMLTVIIAGLAMGATVTISRAVGAKNKKDISSAVGNTVIIFLIFAGFLTAVLLANTGRIIRLLSVPEVSAVPAESYLLVCFAGIPFITAYNVIAAIFRGMGDSRSPMYFVAAAGIINIGLDYYLIGPMRMGAAGAAVATVSSQAFSVLLSLVVLKKMDYAISFGRENIRPDKQTAGKILRVGTPICAQDGFIQVSFMIITVIANRRGVEVAAAVGIVEKVISFLFLVPSSMLSSISAIAAQNAGAGQHQRGKKTLFYGMGISVLMGSVFFIVCQFAAEQILTIFDKSDPGVIRLGAQYLRTYSFDCVAAGVHFCFSGYFSAYQKSFISFLHNVASALLFRIPGAYLASLWFPATLYAMGAAAPIGSAFSALICVLYYTVIMRKHIQDERLEKCYNHD